MLDLNRIQKELNITIHPEDVEIFKKLTSNFCYCIPIIIYVKDIYDEDDDAEDVELEAVDVEITDIYDTDIAISLRKEYYEDEREYPKSYLFIGKDDYNSDIIYDSETRKVFYNNSSDILVEKLSELLNYLVYPSVIECSIDNIVRKKSLDIDSESLFCSISHNIKKEYFKFRSLFEINSKIVNGLFAEDPYSNSIVVNGAVYLLIHDEEIKYRSIKLADSFTEFKAKNIFYLYDYDEEASNRYNEKLRKKYAAEQEKLRKDPKHIPDCNLHIGKFIKLFGKPRVDQKYNHQGTYDVRQAYIDGAITKEEFKLIGEFDKEYESLK